MKAVFRTRRGALIVGIVATLLASILIGAPSAEAVTVPAPTWASPAITSTDTAVTAHWQPVAGATKYYVWWKIPNQSARTLSSITDTSHELSRYNRPAGEYCAIVRAFIGSEYSGVSTEQCTTVDEPEPPPPAVPVPTFGDSPITVTDTNLTLRWNPVAGATKYYVWWKVPDQSGHTLSSITDTSHVLSRHNRPPAGEFCAIVRAFIGSEYSAHSSEQCVTVSAPPPPPPPPTTTTTRPTTTRPTTTTTQPTTTTTRPPAPTWKSPPLVNNGNHLVARWNAVPDATKYYVFWYRPGSNAPNVRSINALEDDFLLTPFTPGEYCARVRTITATSFSSVSSRQCITVNSPPPTTTTTTWPTTTTGPTTTTQPTTTTTRPPTTTTTQPPAPAVPTWRNPALNVSANNVTALWNGVSGASEYQITWTRGGTTVSTKTVRGSLTGFRYTGLTGELCARVRAFNDTTPSGWSTQQCFVAIGKPPPPAWGNPALTTITGWVTAHWEAVPGADTYSVVWTRPDGSTTTASKPSSSTHDAFRVNDVGQYCASIRTNIRPQSSVNSPTQCFDYAGPSTSITGSARAADGNAALPGIGVCSRHIGSNAETCGTTTSTGSFRLEGLTVGDHVLRFVDPENIMEPYCWGTTGSCDTPGTVTLVANQRPHFNAKMVRAKASVSGKVTRDGTSTALRGIRACAIANDGARTCATTATNGRFTINGVPTGTYTVEYSDPGGTYQTQCYRQRSCTNPTRFSLTSFGVDDLDASLVAAPTTPVDPTPPPDRTPPTWLVNRADIYVIQNHDLPGGITVEFTWQGAIDSHDDVYEEPARFDLYLNGAFNQTVDWNTWKLSTDRVSSAGNPRFIGLQPNVGYEFGVVAIDAAGNRSQMYTETKYPLPLARDNGATGSQSGDPEPSKNPPPAPTNPGPTTPPADPPPPADEVVELVPPERIATSGPSWNCRSANFRIKSTDFRRAILEWQSGATGSVLSYVGTVHEAIFQGGEWRPGDRLPISVTGPASTRELEFNGLTAGSHYFLKVKANGAGGELGTCTIEVETRDPVPVNDHPCTDAFGGVAPDGCGDPLPDPDGCIGIGVELPGNDNLSGCLASIAVCVELGITFGIDFGTSSCSIMLLGSREVYQTSGGSIGVGLGLPAHVSYHGARSNAEVASLWSGISACITATFQSGCTGFSQNPDGEPVIFIFDGVMPTTLMSASLGWSNMSQPTGFSLLRAQDALCQRYPEYTPASWCRSVDYEVTSFDLICPTGNEQVMAEVTITRPRYGGPDSATFNVFHSLALPEDAYRSDIVWTPPQVTVPRGQSRTIRVPASTLGQVTIKQWDEEWQHTWSTELLSVPTESCH